jgi:hypothetical protein
MTFIKDNNIYEILNIFYEILEDFILSLTIPGAKDGEEQ